jgi:GcrA cell cycle regulator
MRRNAWWGYFRRTGCHRHRVTSGESISGSALKPHIDFRFEVSLSRGCPLRADNALSAAQTAAALSEAIVMSPSIAPSGVISSPIPSIARTAPVLPDPADIAPASPRIPASTGTWTPERIEQLKSCVERAMTCSQIAAAIGVSRNAVIGKIHRLGLSSGRPAGAPARANCPPRARHPRGPTQRRLLRLAYAQAALDEILSDVVVISLRPCSLLAIDAHQCRWPIGDPAATNFLFCGNDAIGGLAYCVGHARMAYRPATRR